MKIGLFGGAFNPVHNGHMAIARAAIETAKLDKLIFIPTGNAPHKKETQTSRTDRYNMLLEAIRDEEKMSVSDYEINREEVNYSADTVEYFKGVYPNDELYFLVGDDSYNKFNSWYQPHRILENATLLVFPREGATITPPAIEISMDRVEVSSSEIREKIKLGKDCRNLLPKTVFNYIIDKNIYKD